MEFILVEVGNQQSDGKHCGRAKLQSATKSSNAQSVYGLIPGNFIVSKKARQGLENPFR